MQRIELGSSKLCVYLDGNLRSSYGKTGLAVLRYSQSEIVAIMDRGHPGESLEAVTGIRRAVPIVATLDEARALGADTLLIGIATVGGTLTPELETTLEQAVRNGMSVVNGLHRELRLQYPKLKPGQQILDVRKPAPEFLTVGSGLALTLPNRRVLAVGTDMAIGKMSACLELRKAAVARGIKAKFLATGQTGIMIEGTGVPLDAVPVDFASGAVEYGTRRLSEEACDLLFVEGQGSLLNPASTATLPLLRGSQPTHLVLVHMAGATVILDAPHFPIPPLREVVKLYEEISRAGGTFPGANVAGIALNTSRYSSDDEARRIIEETREETGLPTVDAVRFGCEELLDALLR